MQNKSRLRVLLNLAVIGAIQAVFFAESDGIDSVNNSPTPFSDNPTIEEVLNGMKEGESPKFATMTSQNRSAIHTILRRIAKRSGDDLARLIDPARQIDVTDKALSILGSTTDSAADLAFFQEFFERYDDTLTAVSGEPYLTTILQLRDGSRAEDKQERLRGIAQQAMESYAVTAHRLGMDDAAVPALLKKLDHADYDIASIAARALSELQSLAVVKTIEARLPSEEAKFPRGPWDQKVIEQLQEYGGHDTRFGKAFLYLSVLGKMKTPEARAAADAALLRWETIYTNHPQRDKFLTWLDVPKWREDLAKTAAEIATQDPERLKSVQEPTRVTATSGPVVPKETPAVVATTPSDSPSLWMLIIVASLAVALLAGLLIFWKHRT